MGGCCDETTPRSETAEQAGKAGYPTSQACGTLKFTGVAGAAEGRVLEVLPPRRPGFGRRLRLHTAAPLMAGERLRDLAWGQAPAGAPVARGEGRVVSSRALTPTRPPGTRGRRLGARERKARLAPKPVAVKPAPPPPSSGKGKKGKKGEPEPVPVPLPAPVATKPVRRARRVPTGWSVIVEL